MRIYDEKCPMHGGLCSKCCVMCKPDGDGGFYCKLEKLVSTQQRFYDLAIARELKESKLESFRAAFINNEM